MGGGRLKRIRAQCFNSRLPDPVSLTGEPAGTGPARGNKSLLFRLSLHAAPVPRGCLAGLVRHFFPSLPPWSGVENGAMVGIGILSHTATHRSPALWSVHSKPIVHRCSP
eukprot:GGOE01022771.1.p3 GENE.GGOE01022771.1~~GGOE01022771.1.p3  ORF type:complete len:110 (-),score=4.26 GGOE01022771.1:142-471(-)